MLPLLDEAARPDLRSLSLSGLSALVERLGERPYRARQLYSWLHRKGAASLEAMTDLPRAFRERLAAETPTCAASACPANGRSRTSSTWVWASRCTTTTR